MNTTKEFKQKVSAALMDARQNFDGSDATFAKQYGISSSVFSRLKNGETDRVLNETQWLNIGRRLGVSEQWKVVRTEVFNCIERDVIFCKKESTGMVFIDECGIGKTFTAEYLSRKLENCFYVDASQSTTKTGFIRLVARTLGVDSNGKVEDVKEAIKKYLNALPKPVVIVDEAGDLEYSAFMVLKTWMNGTREACGWYMMGADGFRAKIKRGMSNQRVGFAEIFSRFNDHFGKIVPVDKVGRQQFYKKLITDVISANATDKAVVADVTRRCMIQHDGMQGDLRRAKTLLAITEKYVDNE